MPPLVRHCLNQRSITVYCFVTLLLVNYVKKLFLFCVLKLENVAKLENFIANLLGNVDVLKEDLQISFEFLTTFLTFC